MTVMQIGYGVGMLLVVPLGDRFENRRLIVSAFAVVAASLLCAGLAQSAAVFLFAGFSAAASRPRWRRLSCRLPPPSPPRRRAGGRWAMSCPGCCSGRCWHAPSPALSPMRWAGGPSSSFRPAWSPPWASRWRASPPACRRRAASATATSSRPCGTFWCRTPCCGGGPSCSSSCSVPSPCLDSGAHAAHGAVLRLLAGGRCGVRAHRVLGAGAAPLVGWAADRGWARLGAILALSASGAAFLFGFPGTGGGTGPLALLLVAATLIDCGVAASLIISQRAVLALGDAAAHAQRAILLHLLFGRRGRLGAGGLGLCHGGWVLVVRLRPRHGACGHVHPCHVPQGAAAMKEAVRA